MRELVKWTWRSASDTVGVVLVKCGDGLHRAYIGVSRGSDERADAIYIADYGCRLSFREASGFFSGLKESEFTELPDE